MVVFGGHISTISMSDNERVVGLIRDLKPGGGGFLLCESFALDGFLNFRLVIGETDFISGDILDDVLIRADRIDVLDGGRVYLMHFTIEAPR